MVLRLNTNTHNVAKASVVLSLVWTALAVLLVTQRSTHLMENARSLALMEANVSLEKDMVFRRWATSHDGIYVPITKNTQPNPYLAHVPQRDVRTDSGRSFTLLSPAHGLSQEQDSFFRQRGIQVRLVSTTPLNAANLPDSWELQALHRAESDRSRFSEIASDDRGDMLRVFQPLANVAGCYKCHDPKGYRVGGLQGAVSLTMPLLHYYRLARDQLFGALPVIGLMWLMGLAIIVWAYRNLQHYLGDKIADYEQHIFSLVDMIENRDQYTAGHTKRVAQYCGVIARELGVGERDVDLLLRAAMVHDVGKVSTPDSILLKPGRINDLERKIIQQHVVTGYELLRKVRSFKDIAEIVRHHHERFDGRGYPQGLKDDQIPFLSQIMSAADTFDAMTTDRIYKPRKSREEALEEMQGLAGSQLNPVIVEAALNALREISIPTTNQQPASELEKERFAFFYRDQLTGVYNRDYLGYILLTNETESLTHVCLNMIYLKGFTQINENQGWGGGNEVLQRVAAMLQKEFTEGLVFRVYGDDFVVLFENHTDIDERLDPLKAYLAEFGLCFRHSHVRLEREMLSSVEELDRLLTDTIYQH